MDKLFLVTIELHVATTMFIRNVVMSTHVIKVSNEKQIEIIMKTVGLYDTQDIRNKLDYEEIKITSLSELQEKTERYNERLANGLKSYVYHDGVQWVCRTSLVSDYTILNFITGKRIDLIFGNKQIVDNDDLRQRYEQQVLTHFHIQKENLRTTMFFSTTEDGHFDIDKILQSEKKYPEIERIIVLGRNISLCEISYLYNLLQYNDSKIKVWLHDTSNTAFHLEQGEDSRLNIKLERMII